MRLLRGTDPSGERNPFVVGAEDRRRVNASNLKRRIIQSIAAQEPDRAAFGVGRLRASAPRREREQPAVRAPSRRRRVQRRIRQPPCTGAVGRHDPELVLAAIVGLDDRRLDESDGAAVGRHRRRLHGDEAIIVLQGKRASVGASGSKHCDEGGRSNCERDNGEARHGNVLRCGRLRPRRRF